ncbi:MAG TPA: sulfite exporter TauE/SafE family protein [Candidatus Methylomirabilis sp.]|nr:sulfite exporter TauE/SafE family protein [Candidatus Methylomirabilis sp.]
MPAEFQTLLVLLPVACLGSFVYGVTGFGSALITIPLASLIYPLPFVLAVFALLDIVNAVRVGLARPQAIVRDEAGRLIPGCILGVVVGTWLLAVLRTQILLCALGLFVVSFAIYSLLAPEASLRIDASWGYLAGFSGGITSAMFGAGGPPYVIYLSLRPHAKQAMRATLAATSVVSVGARIVAFALAGLLSAPAVWFTAVPLVPAILGALWLADRAHARISRAAMIQAIRLLLLVAGASLVVRSLRGL